MSIKDDLWWPFDEMYDAARDAARELMGDDGRHRSVIRQSLRQPLRRVGTIEVPSLPEARLREEFATQLARWVSLPEDFDGVPLGDAAAGRSFDAYIWRPAGSCDGDEVRRNFAALPGDSPEAQHAVFLAWLCRVLSNGLRGCFMTVPPRAQCLGSGHDHALICANLPGSTRRLGYADVSKMMPAGPMFIDFREVK